MIADRYKVLITVVEEKSLSGAANKLGYTPSGISIMIATLEDEAGIKLFKRSRAGVTPTNECLQLLPAARNIVYYSEQYDQLT